MLNIKDRGIFLSSNLGIKGDVKIQRWVVHEPHIEEILFASKVATTMIFGAMVLVMIRHFEKENSG